MRVLSIDGGGIRGLIPALVLAEIERRSGRRVFELFDLIAGTSTGGILACALCAPDPLPAESWSPSTRRRARTSSTARWGSASAASTGCSTRSTTPPRSTAR